MIAQIEDVQRMNTLEKSIREWYPRFHTLCDWLDDESESAEPAETGLTGSAPFSSHAFQGFDHLCPVCNWTRTQF
jgi:hypothetical protein